MEIHQHYHVIALFSGGLDSILAAKLMQRQGRRVICLHFTTPFFGSPLLVGRWKDAYDLDVLPVDVGADFIAMLRGGPAHGFGKVLNPCVDCKIMLLRKARELLSRFGARVIVTGEVLGQRPMSQRKDALDCIRNEAGVKDVLLRPLCARLLPEIPPETDGFIDRSRLLNFSGRGRKGQMALAAAFGIVDIPTPGGGCLLTERESARNYWPILRLSPEPQPSDFHLARAGRQFWRMENGARWLTVGRTESDNARLEALALSDDLLFSLEDFPGPTALGRNGHTGWNAELVRSAAAHAASFSGKAVACAAGTGKAVPVRVRRANGDGGERIFVVPERGAGGWADYPWERAKAEIRECARSGSVCRDTSSGFVFGSGRVP
jgi:hypothetical protein